MAATGQSNKVLRVQKISYILFKCHILFVFFKNLFSVSLHRMNRMYSRSPKDWHAVPCKVAKTGRDFRLRL